MSMPIGPYNSGPLTKDNRSANGFAQGNNLGSDTFPTAHEVENFHRNSDANKRPEAIHHSLGTSHNQASFGDHSHDGSTSVALLPNNIATAPSDMTGTPIVPAVVPAFTFTQNLDTFQGQKDAIKQLLAVLTTLGIIDQTVANNGVSPFTTHGTYPAEIRTGNAACSWSATGQLSDSTPITFSPPFSALPRLIATCRSTSATIQYLAMQSAGLSVNGGSLRAWTTASLASGSSVPVDWIAILTKTYT